MELATHLTFLPTVLGDVPNPKKIAAHICEFRRRLSPDGTADHWWSYGTGQVEAARSVADLCMTYSAFGEPLFAKFLPFPAGFDQVTPEQLQTGNLTALPGNTTVCRAALALARISRYREEDALAARFVQVGLADLESRPGLGGAIRVSLEDIAAALGVALGSFA